MIKCKLIEQKSVLEMFAHLVRCWQNVSPSARGLLRCPLLAGVVKAVAGETVEHGGPAMHSTVSGVTVISPNGQCKGLHHNSRKALNI